MVINLQTLLRSTELSIAYSPCYKLAAFDGFQFVAKVFRQLAYNGFAAMPSWAIKRTNFQ